MRLVMSTESSLFISNQKEICVEFHWLMNEIIGFSFPLSERGRRIPSSAQNCVFWLFWDIHLVVCLGPYSHASVLPPPCSLFIGSGRMRWDFAITSLCWIHHHKMRALPNRGREVLFLTLFVTVDVLIYDFQHLVFPHLESVVCVAV